MFKVDDKVRCVVAYPSRVLVVGDVYTVSELRPMNCIRVKEVKILHSYQSDKFVKVIQFKGNK